MRRKIPILIAVAVMAMTVAFAGVGAAQQDSVDSGQDTGVDTECHNGGCCPPPDCGGPCHPGDDKDDSDSWGYIGIFDANDEDVDTECCPPDDGKNSGDGSVDVDAPFTDVIVEW